MKGSWPQWSCPSSLNEHVTIIPLEAWKKQGEEIRRVRAISIGGSCTGTSKCHKWTRNEGHPSSSSFACLSFRLEGGWSKPVICVAVVQSKCHPKCARNSWLHFDKIPVSADADATSVLFLEQTKRHHFTKLELADRKLGFDDRFTLIRETKN
jgi:hypothetical protein